MSSRIQRSARTTSARGLAHETIDPAAGGSRSPTTTCPGNQLVSAAPGLHHVSGTILASEVSSGRQTGAMPVRRSISTDPSVPGACATRPSAGIAQVARRSDAGGKVGADATFVHKRWAELEDEHHELAIAIDAARARRADLAPMRERQARLLLDINSLVAEIRDAPATTLEDFCALLDVALEHEIDLACDIAFYGPADFPVIRRLLRVLARNVPGFEFNSLRRWLSPAARAADGKRNGPRIRGERSLWGCHSRQPEEKGVGPDGCAVATKPTPIRLRRSAGAVVRAGPRFLPALRGPH